MFAWKSCSYFTTNTATWPTFEVIKVLLYEANSGHLINAEGLHATSEKLKAIVDAPTPKNVNELRSFLGLLNYYGKFLPNSPPPPQ